MLFTCFRHLVESFCFDYKYCWHYTKRSYFSVLYENYTFRFGKCYHCYRRAILNVLPNFQCFFCLMKIKFKKFSSKDITRSLATPGSACFDLFCIDEALIQSHSCHCLNTDIGLSIPKSYLGKIHARSSWAKRFTSISGGVIDSDYREKIIIVFQNHSDNWFHISTSESIAQICFQKKKKSHRSRA